MKVENDLISRSALIAYVKELPTYDATDRGFIFKRYPSGLFAPDDIVKSIQYSPAVDAVKVVRCRNCKHWMKDVAGCTKNVGRCEFANYFVGSNGYCVYGERKEGADNG